MRSFIMLVGTLLIIGGIGVLGYGGFHYTTQEKIAQIGDVQITTEKDKSVSFPPVVGGISLVAGIILVVLGRNNKIK